MWTRIGIAALFAVVLALPISVGLASANPYPVGRAFLYQGYTTLGSAFVTRQLSSNETHVMVRLSGLAAGTKVNWQIDSGAYCGSTPTSKLLSKSGSSTATSLGTVMTSEYLAGTLSVTSGSAMMTFRINDATSGAELACGQIYDQPSLGSQHWW